MNKVVKIAVPLAIGGGILLSFQFLTSRKSENTAPAASSPVTAAPQDPTHERASLEEELKKKPGHAPILLRLAEVARDQGKAAEAANYLRQLLESDPANKDARLELGRALYEGGDVEASIRETKQLLADHPKNVDALYNLGAIYANENQVALARQYWSEAVAAEPTSESGLKARDGLQKIGP